MVASISKKSGKSPLSKRSALKTPLKGKDDRAARMKAARDAYSKLSLERAKHSDSSHKPEPSAKAFGPSRTATTTNENNIRNRNVPPSPSRTFKPMASSLDMIRNNRVRIPTVGRASSIAGARSLGPRPSLLPLGINVFESNVSVTDQQKVREFLENVAHTGKTPKKPLRSLDLNEPLQSSSRGRTVRFIEATISEQRESGSDELIEESSNRPATSVPEQSTASSVTVPTPQSILKKKAKSPVFRRPPSPKATLHEPTATPTLRRRSLRTSASALVPDPPRLQLSFASSTDSEESSACVRNKGGSGDQQSDFARSYTLLFNMKDEEWRNVEPIMLTELIEHLQNKKEMVDKNAFLQPDDSSCSLLSLPEGPTPCKPRKVGFRRVSSKTSSNTELQANQEVMLINESGQQRVSYEEEIIALPRQLRQRNPVSKTLGGDSPFYPIRGSPSL
ncbi:unnamed protein product [Cylicocyclus nassatus]|uniref:Uncharacterized protein n=1 Tax=Cylicocyclus nassatus TaxID=53992 RepID=A0AA36GIN2_CYLNA|nr:unnamed protein product [Cylicocyclus nassatus]